MVVAQQTLLTPSVTLLDPDEPLLQSKAVSNPHLADLLPENQLLPDTMLGCCEPRGIISVRIGLDKSVPATRLSRGTYVVVHTRPKQKLLPFLPNTLPTPLPVEMNSPRALCELVVTEVHVPGVTIRIRDSGGLLGAHSA